MQRERTRRCHCSGEGGGLMPGVWLYQGLLIVWVESMLGAAMSDWVGYA
jgi:hypothetical protein